MGASHPGHPPFFWRPDGPQGRLERTGAMTKQRVALLLIAAGVIVLLSTWGNVADWTESKLRGEQQVRGKKVVYWTSSGSPEVDLKRARQFEKLHPDINVDPNFRETGGLQDILFISFLSGNPPDYMDAKLNELRKYVLIGGIRPLDELVDEENARAREAYEAVRQGLQAELAEMKRSGAAADELAKLAEKHKRILAETPKSYYDKYQIGKARICRFTVNPDDATLAERDGAFVYPKEAARLLAMNGRAIGFRGVAYPSTLTYNKRIFREAARRLPQYKDKLVDEHDEPIPPRTWLQFHETARILTEYGRALAKDQGRDEADPVCYGVVMQGQRHRDIMRGIRPLAYSAGSMAFHFAGDAKTVHRYLTKDEVKKKLDGKPIGFFEYHHPAFLAAFALLCKLKHDDFVLPGTESRHYEDVRTALAAGKAGMLIDGWHAALIGAERVPYAAQDLGSAPVPIPYPPAGSAKQRGTGLWTQQEIDELKRKTSALLCLDQVGIELPPGNKMPRTAEESIQFFTAMCRAPRATWRWVHFEDEMPRMLQAETRRGVVRLEKLAMRHIDDREWHPYPYQKQVAQILDDHCEMWPERPLHGTVKPAQDMEVFYKYFYQKGTKDLAEILGKARREVAEFTAAANEDLARRIEDGIVRPENWTFPDWDVQRAGEFFERQQGGARVDDVGAKLEEKKQRLIACARRHPSLKLLDEAGTGIRQDIWRFEPPHTAWQLAWVPALMFLVVGGWFVHMAVRNLRAQRRPFHQLGQMRQNSHAYVFVLPGMLAIFAFAVYPSLYQFWLSAQRGDGLGTMQYVGGENFRRILDVTSPDFDSIFWKKVVPNTLLYMLVVTAGQICIGLLFANLLNLPLRANKVYRVLYFIPLVTSLAIVSVILEGLLKGEDAGLNELLAAIGLPIRDVDGKALNWLGPGVDLYTIMAVGIWHGLPYNIILLLAGLQSINPELYEAAKVDGANAWRRFLHITLPELTPLLIVIAFQAFIGAARAFSVAFVLTEGGVGHSSELVATYVFKKGFMKPEGLEPDLGYASALGIVYSLLLAALTIANVVIIARRWKGRLAAEREANRPMPALAGGPANV